MFEISSSPVSAVIVTHALMSVPAFVMKIFEPSTTHSPSRSSARVRVAPASEPAFGSVSPNAASLSPDASRGSHSCFCCVVAEEVDRHRPERRVRRDGDRHRRVDARQLLDRDRVRDGVGAGAAVLLGDRDAHQPELGELRRRARTGSAPRGRAPPRRARRATPRSRARCAAAALARRSARSSCEERGELRDQPYAVAGAAGHAVVVAARCARGNRGRPCRCAPTGRRRRTPRGTSPRARASPGAASSRSSCRRTPSRRSAGSARAAGTATTRSPLRSAAATIRSRQSSSFAKRPA